MDESQSAGLSTTNLPKMMSNRPFYLRWYDWVRNVQPLKITWNVFLWTSIAIIIGGFSLFTYGIFYYAYIPQTTFIRQIHLRRSQIVKERPDVDGFMMKTRVQALHGELHLSAADDSDLLSGQGYSMDIELYMPDSEVNHNAGTFMVSVLFYDKMDNLLTSNSRLIMLKYRSWLLRILDTLVYAPLYLIGFSDQSQTRHIPLIQDYVENAYSRTELVVVDIDNADLQVYDAHVMFRAELKGIRYYMYHWWMTTSIIVSAMFWVLYFLIMSILWAVCHVRPNKKIVKNFDPNHSGVESTPSKTLLLGQSMSKDELAPNTLDASLCSVERAAVEVDYRTEVTSLGVTPLDSSDTRNVELTIRQRRNHPDEQSCT